MRDFERILSEFQKNVVEAGPDGAAFEFHLQGALIMWVIASFGDGWDHVSVTLNRERCPKWSEMCMVKEMFFEPEEAVMQIHPPKSQYVNNHPYCLHLWRPHNCQIPLPNKNLV